MDALSKAKRSRLMARVRSHGNKATELVMAELLRKHHVCGWRRRQKLLGSPDSLFPRKKLAIFIDGCFWHGCPRCYRRPGSHRKYWDAKVLRNRQRDRLVCRELHNLGWHVIRIWEHNLARHPETCLRRISGALAKARRELGATTRVSPSWNSLA